MSTAPPQPVAYARPGFTPPAGATFTLHERPDGVTFERPLPDRPGDRVVLIGLACLTTIVVAGMVAAFVIDDAHPARNAAMGVPAPLALAAACLLVVPRTRPRVQTIDLTGLDLFVANGPWSPPNRRRHYRAVRWFDSSLPGTDVVRMRAVASVLAKTGRLSKSVIVAGLSRAECDWVVAILQTTLERNRSAVPVVPL